MSDQIISGVLTVAMGLLGVATIAALVSRNAATSQVISSAAGGFAQDLGVALGPVSGTSLLGGTTFGGGGALYGSGTFI